MNYEDSSISKKLDFLEVQIRPVSVKVIACCSGFAAGENLQ